MPKSLLFACLLTTASMLTLGCGKPVPPPEASANPQPSEDIDVQPIRPVPEDPVRDVDTVDSPDGDVVADSGTAGQDTAVSPPESDLDEPDYSIYIVKKGDTGFWGIARKALGNGRRWKEVRDLNPGVDPTKLQVGQKIRVPKD